MRNVLATTLLVTTLSVVGCSPTLAPVYSPAETAGINAAGAPFSWQQIDQAVVAGAQAKGWTVVSAGPGLTIAEVHAGGHSARVRIVTNEVGWRVLHEQSSPGLRYGVEERHGEVIHRRYNHWVRLLDESIRAHLRIVSAAPIIAAPVAAPAPAPVAPSTP